MFNVDDRVKVVKLIHDEENTNIEIGWIGTVAEYDKESDVYDVIFDKTITFTSYNPNYDSSRNTYQMCSQQLEMIEVK